MNKEVWQQALEALGQLDTKRRTAQDGEHYTMKDFVEHYWSTEQWDAAPRCQQTDAEKDDNPVNGLCPGSGTA